MYLFMEEYVILFIVALITLSITIILRSSLIALLEVVLINLPAVLPNNTVVVIAITVIQIALALAVVYKFFAATKVNYDLVLEKTHLKEPELSKGRNGTRFSFWKTD